MATVSMLSSVVTVIVLMMSSINATKCSSDSDCASHEGCLSSENKCYHRFNVSDFSVLKLMITAGTSWFPNDPDSDDDGTDTTAFHGDQLSPIFDRDLSTFVTAEGKMTPSWYFSLSFASDRWVKSMSMVLQAPSFTTEKPGVHWTWNTKLGGTDSVEMIENDKYEKHTVKTNLPAAVHKIEVDIWAMSWCNYNNDNHCSFYIHSLEILGSYKSPSIPSISDISMISMDSATVSTQPCCHDYGFMVKEDKVNLRDASLGTCERTITTQCCGNTLGFTDQSSTQYEYRCGFEGDWYPVYEPQYYDEGLCNISWFNTTTADVVGTVVHGENILFDVNDISRTNAVSDFCQCNYTINECEGEDIAVCGSQETYDELFAADCWNNESWTFTDNFQGEDCWKDTLENNPEYEHLLWEPCGAQSFHGMHSEFVDVSAEHIHNGECNCTYYVPTTTTTTTEVMDVSDVSDGTEEEDAVQCVLQKHMAVITTILVVGFT